MAIPPATSKTPRPTALWIRVLAIIGVLLLLERTTTWYLWSSRPDHPFSAIGNFGIGSPTSFEKTPAAESSANLSKSIVVASISKEYTGWINENFADYEINVYVTDDPEANYTVLHNTGRESSVYLTYIINHYWSLPDIVLFLHAKRYQWHNDEPMYDGIPTIKNLRIEHIQSEGYTSLRCAQDPGCPLGLIPEPEKDDDFWSITHAYAKAFRKFFPNDPLPKLVAAPCCAQFAVTKEAIQARPPADYERMRQWLWDTDIVEGKSGRVFEYMWHYIFGQPIVHCPSADECYCKTFGLCDLKCPGTPKKCQGRFRMPPYDKGFPKGWPNKGLGTDGYPEDKWWEEFYPPEEYDESMHLRNGSRTPEQAYPSIETHLDPV